MIATDFQNIVSVGTIIVGFFVMVIGVPASISAWQTIQVRREAQENKELAQRIKAVVDDNNRKTEVAARQATPSNGTTLATLTEGIAREVATNSYRLTSISQRIDRIEQYIAERNRKTDEH